MGFEQKRCKSIVPFSPHHPKVITLSIWSMAANAGLHHLAEAVFVRVLHCKPTHFSLFLYWVFGRVKVCGSYLMSKGSWFTSSKVWTYVVYLEFFLMGDFSLLYPRSSIYSIFYLYQYHVVDIYFTFGL